MISPGQPTGMGPEASYFARLEAYCKSGRLLPGVGYRLKQYTHGVVLEFPPRGGPGGAPSSISEYIVQKHGDYPGPDADYVLCVPSGSNPQDSSITPTKLIKPYLLRFSIAQRIVQGQTLTYSQWDSIAQSRQATNALGSIQQFITPQYAAGDIIVGTQVGAHLQDLNVDGRVFASP